MDNISGGLNPVVAPKGKRILSDLFDLIFIPIVLGVIAGIVLMSASDIVRGIVMVVFNVGWLVFRDAVFAPGRALTGLKLVSLDGAKITPMQAVIRNILLIIPVVLLIGYIVEIISVLSKDERLGDRWAKTRVVAA